LGAYRAGTHAEITKVNQQRSGLGLLLLGGSTRFAPPATADKASSHWGKQNQMPQKGS
jgi:hypothetical protein